MFEKPLLQSSLGAIVSSNRNHFSVTGSLTVFFQEHLRMKFKYEGLGNVEAFVHCTACIYLK